MLIKVHKSYRDLVAICDKDILGKKFEEEDRILEIKEDFYNGEEISYKDLIQLMVFMYKEDATFNIVGKESIKAAIESGIILEEGIRKVEGIPFALVLL